MIKEINGLFLILEEIENHLYPEIQLILVKYLFKAINKGLNIILNTVEWVSTKKEVFNKWL